MKLSLKLMTLSLSFTSLVGCQTAGLHKQKTFWKHNQQMILVLSDSWNANNAILLKFQFKHQQWNLVGQPFTVILGKYGSAWGANFSDVDVGDPVKREGDMRSPAGIYQIGESFGYARALNIVYPYKALNKNNFCVDDKRSKYYNQIIDRKKIAFDTTLYSAEPMRHDIYLNGNQQYRLGLIIKYNEKNIIGAGSCIFMHLRKQTRAYTAGCTAMHAREMEGILRWLNVKNNPVFVLLPKNAYQKKVKEWDLPIVKFASDKK